MRLIKMTGGLGNQMFIFAFYMQMKKRFPDTRIDLSDMVHYHVHYGYEINRVFRLPRPASEFCINQPLKKVLEFLFFKTILERKQNLETMEAFRRSYAWPLIYFKGFYQTERHFSAVRDEVREAFSFDVAKANRHTREMLQRIEADGDSCSFHVRRGDYLQPQHWENTGSVCGLTYYRNAVAEMLRRRPHTNFYIFSDDISWVKKNLPFDNAVLIDWNTGEDSWQDMLLMSRCHHHVICNSTFSWWGAWLGRHADKLVLAPERWFRHDDTPYIYPEDWIKVSID